MATKIQSILIPRDLYRDIRMATYWVYDHNYIVDKVDITDTYFRFRQYAPRKNQTYRTIKFGEEGIKAVVQVEKKRGK